MLCSEQCIVEGRIGVQRRDLGRRRVRVDQLLGLEREDREVVLGVDTQQLLCAELQKLDRGCARQWQDDLDSVLPEDVDLPVSELAFARADGEERLDGVVCDLCDFGVYAIVADLVSSAWVRMHSMRRAGPPRGAVAQAHTWSSTKRSAPRPAERSPWMPACLPRRRCAMVVVSHRCECPKLDLSVFVPWIGLHSGSAAPSLGNVICRVLGY
jgi:hypothetical protein